MTTAQLKALMVATLSAPAFCDKTRTTEELSILMARASHIANAIINEPHFTDVPHEMD